MTQSTEELLSKLNPRTAQAFRRASEIELETLETPSLGINRAVRGIGFGRQTMIWGNQSAGKTALCLGLAAKAQAEGRTVGWVDAERNFEPAWAIKFGVNPDDVLWSPVTSIADMADFGYDLIRAGVDLMVVDSISTLLPQSYFEDKELKELAKTGQIGTFSKNMGQAVNMFNSANKSTAIVLVSQVRNAIGSYGASMGPMGGKAVEHTNSMRIKLWANPSSNEAIKQKVTEGNITLERPVGREVTWTIDKNRGPGMNESGKYDFYFRGPHIGVDLAGEIISIGTELGVVSKGGAWYTINGESLQGKRGASQYLRDNPDVMQQVYDEILAKGQTDA